MIVAPTGIIGNRERVDELFTMPAAANRGPHAISLYKDKYVIVGTRDGNLATPSVANTVARFDVDDFANNVITNLPTGVITVPGGTYQTRVNDQTIIGDTLYMAYTCGVAQTNPIVIGTLDIPTMTLGSNIIYTPTGVPVGTFGPNNGNITSDGVRYLYYSPAEPRATIYKFDTWNSNTMVAQWLSDPLLIGRGHAVKYFNGALYASSNQASATAGGLPAFNWIVKVDPDTMTELARNVLGPAGVATSNPPTDDFCVANGKVYLPIDINTGVNQTPLGNIYVLDADDLAYITSITDLTINGGKGYSYVTEFDGRHVYAGMATSPGKLLKIDPVDESYTVIDLGVGNDSPNEITFSNNKGVAFITFYLGLANPYKIGRYYNL